MARFGLLALNKGKWKNEQILNESYFNASVEFLAKVSIHLTDTYGG
ncbi:MAG: hypothetical protein MZV63_33090 [Marinilabiliales bacterium]|nr:hypothetical protein [Marinilabiliales bacterium]